MAAINSISSDKLHRLIGTPGCPLVIDVRTAEAAAALPALIPGAVRRAHETVRDWAAALDGRAAVVACRKGSELSAGVAAWLRSAGVPAEKLEGGVEGWAEQGYPLVPEAALPPRDAQGRTLWVTRARPKVDRIACPWLIRRFVDREAIFLFVAPTEVEGVAARFGATPFDVEGVHWSHRGELCSFDVMVEEFALRGFPALERLAVIVRGADTARPELAPQAAGLLAVSLGLSRMHGDDHEQLDAGMAVYDALYRWCRDAVDETHDWVSHTPGARVKA
ncbi:chromate resistance protein ChrB domain-containing protein [Sphingosinicella sp.]|uniref:chromate resistance protein ChrB domain-containing protein n=1 Tax=Sphingosinicella sp. TaxID=1917971 RepID=UPI00403840A9